MRDSRILSSFEESSQVDASRLRGQMPELARARDLVFDTCKVGVVLRTVLFVQAIAAVVGLFGTHTVLGWLTQMALFTGAALPATLLWLLAVCALKKPLGRLTLYNRCSDALRRVSCLELDLCNPGPQLH